MKAIISSRYLASKLNEIDFTAKWIKDLYSENDKTIVLHFNTDENITLMCEVGIRWPHMNQENVRWDWVKKLVNQVDEQPIILNINESRIEIIFQY